MDLSSASDFFGPLARYKSTAVVLSIGAACVLANGILSKRAVRGKKKPSSWNWNEEIVVVTGGSGGIGRELVDGFARRGVTVVSLDVKPAPPAVTDIVADIAKQKTRGRTYHYQVDVTSREAVRDVGRRIRDEVGGDPTVLINNAGLAVGRPLLDGDEQTVRAVFGVNLLAHFWTAHEFLPAMIARDHGHVISMASVASYVTLASNVEYSCTKAGVQAFHEGLGQDLRHRYGAKSVLTRYASTVYLFLSSASCSSIWTVVSYFRTGSRHP